MSVLCVHTVLVNKEWEGGGGWIVPGVDSARVDSARGTLVLYFTYTVLYCKDLKSIYNYK